VSHSGETAPATVCGRRSGLLLGTKKHPCPRVLRRHGCAIPPRIAAITLRRGPLWPAIRSNDGGTGRPG